jgi:hypothetical protein
MARVNSRKHNQMKKKGEAGASKNVRFSFLRFLISREQLLTLTSLW